MNCKADGCEEEVVVKGLCRRHYYKAYRGGDFNDTIRSSKSLQAYIDELPEVIVRTRTEIDEMFDEHFPFISFKLKWHKLTEMIGNSRWLYEVPKHQRRSQHAIRGAKARRLMNKGLLELDELNESLHPFVGDLKLLKKWSV